MPLKRKRTLTVLDLIGSNKILTDRVVQGNNIEEKTTLLQSLSFQKGNLCRQQLVKTNYVTS